MRVLTNELLPIGIFVSAGIIWAVDWCRRRWQRHWW